MKVSQGWIFTIPLSKATFIFLKKKVVPYKLPQTSGINTSVNNNHNNITRVEFFSKKLEYFFQKIINTNQTTILSFKLFRHDVSFHKLILL